VKYLLVCIQKGLPPNDKFHTHWSTWAGGRYIRSGKNDSVTLIEVEAENDEAAAQAARSFEIWNRVGSLDHGLPAGGPWSDLPVVILSMHRLGEEVPVDGTALRAAFMAEMDAEAKRRADQKEREEYEKLRAKYEKGGAS
jgi:hypothetical protein